MRRSRPGSSTPTSSSADGPSGTASSRARAAVADRRVWLGVRHRGGPLPAKQLRRPHRPRSRRRRMRLDWHQRPVDANTPYWIVVRGAGAVGALHPQCGPARHLRHPTPAGDARAGLPGPEQPCGRRRLRRDARPRGRVCLTVLTDFSAVTSFQMTDVPFDSSPCNVTHRTRPIRRRCHRQPRVRHVAGLVQRAVRTRPDGAGQLRAAFLFAVIPCTSGVVRWNATTPRPRRG